MKPNREQIKAEIQTLKTIKPSVLRMSAENEVKKCPFCGGKARTLPSIAHDREWRATCQTGRCCMFNHCIEISEWNRRATVSIETAQKLADSIMAYIDEFGLDHEDDDCPDDDTCKCERRQAINEALSRFNAEKGGV